MLTIEPEEPIKVSCLSPKAEKIVKRLLGKKAWEMTCYVPYEPMPPCNEEFPFGGSP